MKDKYLNLFAFCKVIEGTEYSVVCDFQKKNIKFIPNLMLPFLKDLNKLKIDSLKNKYKDSFSEYYKFLLIEKFIFLSDQRDEFINIPEVWETPEVINNAVLEYDFNHYNIIDVLKQLDSLNCKYIELRFLSASRKSILDIEEILYSCNISKLRSIKIYLPFTNDLTGKELVMKFKKFKKIEYIIIYNSPKKRIRNNSKLIFLEQSMSEVIKGNIDEDLIIDLNYYLESLNYNPYYNKKVCINYLGNVKNCIKNKRTFQNINKTSIIELINMTDFKEFWSITPEKIIDCKGDPLRYNKIYCSDFTKISDNRYKIMY